MTLTERLNVYEKLMRLDKPIGIALLLWPTLWGLWLSSNGQPHPIVAWIFILGVVLMRSAGCIVNDFADRNFDAHVERTKDRPLAAKLISPWEALALAAVLAGVAFTLVLTLSPLTIKLSLIALALAVIYPFLKRVFPLPQAWLGIAFGFGIPMAFAAHGSYIHPVAWVMMIANMFWAIAYDTEYAMVDKSDDLKLKLKSSAILFGRFDVLGVMVCHAAFLLIMGYVGWSARLGFAYFMGLAVAACFAAYQYTLIHDRDRARTFRAFGINNLVGAAIFAGLVVDFLLPIPLFPDPSTPPSVIN